MSKIIIAFFLSFLSFNIHAQEKYLRDVNETQEFSKEVIALFKDNKISESFDELTPYWPLPQNEVDAIEEKTIKYLNILRERFGKPIGALKVKNETIGDVAIRETYLVRFEYTAIRVIFTYYQNDYGWIINAFKWDDSFTEEFK